MNERPIDYGLTIRYSAMSEREAWKLWRRIDEVLAPLNIPHVDVIGWGPMMPDP